jgi:hypothetical protein
MLAAAAMEQYWCIKSDKAYFVLLMGPHETQLQWNSCKHITWHQQQQRRHQINLSTVDSNILCAIKRILS